MEGKIIKCVPNDPIERSPEDILDAEIFENEDDVIKIMARFDEYDRDKQILIKILLNINKSLKIRDN